MARTKVHATQSPITNILHALSAPKSKEYIHIGEKRWSLHQNHGDITMNSTATIEHEEHGKNISPIVEMLVYPNDIEEMSSYIPS